MSTKAVMTFTPPKITHAGTLATYPNMSGLFNALTTIQLRFVAGPNVFRYFGTDTVLADAAYGFPGGTLLSVYAEYTCNGTLFIAMTSVAGTASVATLPFTTAPFEMDEATDCCTFIWPSWNSYPAASDDPHNLPIEYDEEVSLAITNNKCCYNPDTTDCNKSAAADCTGTCLMSP